METDSWMRERKNRLKKKRKLLTTMVYSTGFSFMVYFSNIIESIIKVSEIIITVPFVYYYIIMKYSYLPKYKRFWLDKHGV